MKIKNVSDSVYKLGSGYKGHARYVWQPGETLDVPDEVAAHVLDAQAGRFEKVAAEPPHPVKSAPDRMHRGGRQRG